MHKILAISDDESLLTTRAAVLRKTNAQVTTATARQAKKILKSRKFDLVVLCQSLDVDETIEIASLAHHQTIAVPVLCVVANAVPISEWRFIAPDSVASSDPRILVERVAELLRVSQLGVN